MHEHARLPVTISAGVSAWQPTVADSPTLLDAADRALYSAKRGGRSRAESSQ
ncbi:MAG: diguanylate cyclase [Deltaproteobacteria bacterium]|nr:diguanylate cyclase [Deltaproteobacteria bacterium]